MRRSTMAAIVTVVAMTLVTGASASPTSASPVASARRAGTAAPPRVKAGSEWTVELAGGDCESDSFAAHHTFTAVDGADGDQGTYTGTKKLAMTWTAGAASGEVFKGRWHRSTGDYTGADVHAGVSVAATLVPVAAGGCATLASVPGSSAVSLGSTDTDTATVTGEAGITPAGDVLFYVCPGDAAPCTPSSSGAVDLGTSPLAGSGDTAKATSAAYSPSATGSYCFESVYAGNDHYGSASDSATADECFTVLPSTPTVTTTVDDATVDLGASDSDTATVTGEAGITPTGDVHFYVCAGDAEPCTTTTSGVTDLGGAAVAGSGGTATAHSAGYTAPATGHYCFLAVYLGDANYASASDGSTADECFTVAPDASAGPGIAVEALNEVGPHEVLTGGTGQFVVSGTMFLNTNVADQPWSGSSASVTGTASLGTAASGIDIKTGSNDTVDVVVDGTPYTLTIAAGSYSGSTLLSAVQSAVSEKDLNAAYNYVGDLVLSTRDGVNTTSSLQVTGGDALSTLGLSVMSNPMHGTVFDDAIDAKAASTLDVYGTIDTNDGTFDGESLWPLDTCFEPQGAIASGPAQTLSSGNPPGVQVSCATPSSSVTIDYNAIDNQFPQESDPLQGSGAPPNPFSSLSADNCPGMSEQMNPPEVSSGSATVFTPGVYTTPVDLTDSATFENCSGYSDAPANNGQPEAASPGIYVFEDGLAIDPAAGDTVTGSDVVLATQSPYPVAGNVPGSATDGMFSASGAGNGAPCLPSTTRTDPEDGGGQAMEVTVQPPEASPCAGTSPAEYGTVAYDDSSFSPDPSETGTGTNFSALVGGAGTVSLTGPTTGAYGGSGSDGIVFYQDPDTPANYGFDAGTGDSAAITVNGVVYNASLPNYGNGGPLDYWDGIGGGVPFYQGGTLQTGFGTGWSDGPAVSGGSVTLNGTAVVDDVNTDGTTDMRIVGGTYSPPGAQSSFVHRTSSRRRHRRLVADRSTTRRKSRGDRSSFAPSTPPRRLVP